MGVTPTPLPPRPFSNSPKDKAKTGTVVIMGEVARAAEKQRVTPALPPDPALEGALQRLRENAGFAIRSHAGV